MWRIQVNKMAESALKLLLLDLCYRSSCWSPACCCCFWGCANSACLLCVVVCVCAGTGCQHNPAKSRCVTPLQTDSEQVPHKVVHNEQVCSRRGTKYRPCICTLCQGIMVRYLRLSLSVISCSQYRVTASHLNTHKHTMSAAVML